MTEGRLLVLDDDADVGQTLGMIAEGAGLEWLYTGNAGDFFHQLAQWNPTHLAIDLVMPDMDGVQVMQKLAEMDCRAGVIITSGVGSRVLDAARRSASEHGLNVLGVASKPFSLPTLRDMLRRRGNGAARIGHLQHFSLDQFQITREDLERGLEARELVMAYQPKLHCGTGELSGFEVLVRWQHPEAGLIMPDHFIPLAEEVGLITLLTQQVLDSSLSWFAHHCGHRPLTLAVNISARDLVEFRFADQVAELCSKWNVAPETLTIELTESSAMEDPVLSLDLLTRLRMKGFHLSIDDFGTGFSSMVQLARLPFSEVKVDKSFVMNAMISTEARTVTRSIVELAANLGLKSTAEGVEDGETLAFLKEIGCDQAQGYYISVPLWGDEAVAWMKNH